MQIKKIENNLERAILTSMIVDRLVLAKIASLGLRNPFSHRWSNLVADWCIKYFNKYNKAPQKNIEQIFQRWCRDTRQEQLQDLIARFLSTLSDDYEQATDKHNSQYMIDIAGEYFNKVELERLTDVVNDKIAENDIDGAVKEVVNFNKVELGIGEGVDILQDKVAIEQAFAYNTQPLVSYSGDLGKFLNQALCRDAFISFLGPEKSGKSFWLLDIAYRALLQRRRVAYFEAGDMSQNQVMRRFMVRIMRRPIFPATVEIPTGISKLNGDKQAFVTTKQKVFKDKMNWKDAYRACQRLVKSRIKSKESYLKLSCHPNSTLSVARMKGILAEWGRNGWVPDIIVIDYADILDMTYHGKEGRECINETWKQLRGLSQEYHCLVITATQANAAAYDKDTLNMSNFSEDKRKIAHVTGMLGINTSSKEREDGISRLNWIALREGSFNIGRCVNIARCLEIANPAVKSCF